MKKLRKTLSLLLAVVMLLPLIACGGDSDPSGDSPGEETSEPYEIGIVMPMSGATALLGNQAYWGADIARQMFNERGGLDGRQVEFVVGDGYDVTPAATEANRIIDTYDVDIIIGSLLGTHGVAIKQVTERNGKILWETSGISKGILDNNQGYTFRLCDEGPLRATNSVQFVVEEICPILGKEPAELRVGWVCPENDFAREIGGEYVAEAEEIGWNYALEEYYDTTTMDYTGIVQNIKAADLDVLFAYGGVSNVQLMVDAMIQYDAWPDVLIGLGEGFNDTSFLNNMGEDVVEGIFVVDMPTNVSTDQLTDEENVALLNEFRERYMEDHDYDYVPLAADLVFMGTWVLLEDVLKNCSELTVDEIASVAQNLDIPETTMGWSVKFDERGQNTGAGSVLMQWQNGSLVTIWPDKFALGELDLDGVPLAK